tara:strand:+ start:356 stop:541 length:186 start_codon:yes stop_codon:yes gene_type:complete
MLIWEKMSGGVTMADVVMMPTMNHRALCHKKRRVMMFFAKQTVSTIGDWKIIMPPNKKEMM